MSAVRPGDLPHPGAPSGPLSLVDDDTIEREILTSRLALAVMDKAASGAHRSARAHVLVGAARSSIPKTCCAPMCWRASSSTRLAHAAGCSLDSWRELQLSLHDELAALVEEAYHETNRWLVEQGVLPDVDLHPYIKRERNLPMPATGSSGGPGGGGGGGSGHSGYGHSSGFGAAQGPGQGPSYGGGTASGSGYGGGGGGGGSPHYGAPGHGGGPGTVQAGGPGRGSTYRAGSHGGASGDGTFPGRGSVGEETRMMARSAPLARREEHAEAVLGRLNRLVGRHLPSVQRYQPRGAEAVTGTGPGHRPGASRHPQTRRRQHPARGEPTVTTPALMEELHQRKQALKQSAATPEERAPRSRSWRCCSRAS